MQRIGPPPNQNFCVMNLAMNTGEEVDRGSVSIAEVGMEPDGS